MSLSLDKLGQFRDRTNLYISYRQSYTHHPAKRTRFSRPGGDGRHYSDAADSERAGLMSGQFDDGDVVIEMDLLPPRWLDIQDDISATLADVAVKMKKLEQMHAKHVLPGFDDESVKALEEREIESLTQDITRSFIACQARIRKIDALVREQKLQQGGHLSKADETMARNLRISLASRVGEVSTLFRKRQSAYLKKLRALGGFGTPTDARAATPALASNPYTDPALMDSETDRASAQSTLLQTAQVRRRTGVLDAAIEQREREIEKIAQGVIDLSSLFQELNSMVIDQGTLLDRIDYNVERTVEQVKAAEKELTVATGYQKRSTKRKIILLLILIVLGLFILLLVKPRRSRSPPQEPVIPAEPGTAAGSPSRILGMVRERRVDRATAPMRRSEWKQRRRRLSSVDGTWSFMAI
ncbi:MAG: hypothetical protein FE78DRAFT_85404 [Acidomyces sp. 'richmondensis']|nr:MAG: hypothetical protein FE78DRAFT_85404 [Acidomyces sp. 'richmondensis']